MECLGNTEVEEAYQSLRRCCEETVLSEQVGQQVLLCKYCCCLSTVSIKHLHQAVLYMMTTLHSSHPASSPLLSQYAESSCQQEKCSSCPAGKHARLTPKKARASVSEPLGYPGCPLRSSTATWASSIVCLVPWVAALPTRMISTWLSALLLLRSCKSVETLQACLLHLARLRLLQFLRMPRPSCPVAAVQRP